MLNKITFYGYFFTHEYDRITAYDILWREPQNFLLKTTSIDLEFADQSEEIVVMVYDLLYSCLAAIIGRLRNSEIEMGLYKPLEMLDQLPDNYRPLLAELEESIIQKNTVCISIFGNLNKYKSQAAAKDVLNKMGYMSLTTTPPHLYLLEDYIRQEGNAISNHTAKRTGLL